MTGFVHDRLVPSVQGSADRATRSVRFGQCVLAQTALPALLGGPATLSNSRCFAIYPAPWLILLGYVPHSDSIGGRSATGRGRPRDKFSADGLGTVDVRSILRSRLPRCAGKREQLGRSSRSVPAGPNELLVWPPGPEEAAAPCRVDATMPRCSVYRGACLVVGASQKRARFQNSGKKNGQPAPKNRGPHMGLGGSVVGREQRA